MEVLFLLLEFPFQEVENDDKKEGVVYLRVEEKCETVV